MIMVNSLFQIHIAHRSLTLVLAPRVEGLLRNFHRLPVQVPTEDLRQPVLESLSYQATLVMDFIRDLALLRSLVRQATPQQVLASALLHHLLVVIRLFLMILIFTLCPPNTRKKGLIGLPSSIPRPRDSWKYCWCTR